MNEREKMKRTILVGVALAALALTGCTGRVGTLPTGPTPTATGGNLGTGQPSIPGAPSMPAGCNANNVPNAYDDQQTIAWGTACTDQAGGNVTGDPAAWCRANVDGNAAPPDTSAELHSACLAGIKAGGGA